MIITYGADALAHFKRLKSAGIGVKFGRTDEEISQDKIKADGVQKLAIRNQRIRTLRSQGWPKSRLANHYLLSIKRINTILRGD